MLYVSDVCKLQELYSILMPPNIFLKIVKSDMGYKVGIDDYLYCNDIFHIHLGSLLIWDIHDITRNHVLYFIPGQTAYPADGGECDRTLSPWLPVAQDVARRHGRGGREATTTQDGRGHDGGPGECHRLEGGKGGGRIY